MRSSINTGIAIPGIGRIAETALIVEYCGFPGAGKTTAANRLVDETRGRTMNVLTRLDLLYDGHSPFRRHCFRFLLIARQMAAAPALFLRTGLVIFRCPQRRRLDVPKLVWNYWSVIAAIRRYQRMESRSALVLDQGIIQAVWSVMLEAKGADLEILWQKLVAPVGLRGTVLVFVDVPWQTAQSRLRSRLGFESRIERREALGQREQWEYADSVLQRLVRRAASEGTKVITCDEDARTAPDSVSAATFSL